jgi:hypothetical protein
MTPTAPIPLGRSSKSCLKRADRSKLAKNRTQAMQLMSKIPPDFPKADLTRAARVMSGLDRTRPAAWRSLLRLLLAMGKGPR